MEIAAAQRLWDAEPGWLNTASYGLPWHGTRAGAGGTDRRRRQPRPQPGPGEPVPGRLGQPPGRGAIVTVDVPAAEERLRRAGVRAAVRAGRVRASCHVYTTEADVDRALDALTA